MLVFTHSFTTEETVHTGMATYSVTPLPDGVDMRSNWQVKKSGSRMSAHTSKQGAENAARRDATEGDRIKLYGTNGQITNSYTYQGSRNSESDQAGPWTAKDWANRTSDDMLGL